MARKNRLVAPDGKYHITMRCANKAFLLKDEALKMKIVTLFYAVADFSGATVHSWCVMDNHLHLLVSMPRVPERYWLDPGVEPQTCAWSMRPSERNPPRWDPALDPIPSRGDSPCAAPQIVSEGGFFRAPIVSSHGDSPCAAVDWQTAMVPSRPPVRFAIPDDEMITRLKALYGNGRKVQALAQHWQTLRAAGQASEIESEKECYYRRMYNISQFAKTLAERISNYVNRTTGHTGHLWGERFYSGLVEENVAVLATIAGYIDYNPVRGGLSPTAGEAKWTSYAWACGKGASGKWGKHAIEHSRAGCNASRGDSPCAVGFWNSKIDSKGCLSGDSPRGMGAGECLSGDSPRGMGAGEDGVSGDGAIDYVERCRAGYESLLGVTWDAARKTLEALFAKNDLKRQKWTAQADEAVQRMGGRQDDGAEGMEQKRRVTAVELIARGSSLFSRGVMIGQSMAFFKCLCGMLPQRLACTIRCPVSLKACMELDWTIPAAA